MSTNEDSARVATADISTDITHEVHDISTRPINYGGYADIYLGVWRAGHSEQKVAIKVLRTRPMLSETDTMPRALRREISVWKRLVHRNIHIMCGLIEGMGSAPAMVSPWCENGDINKYVRRHAGEPMVGPLKLNLLVDVMTGLEFLHGKEVVHGDIKGVNVLISDEGVALLADFGLSRMLSEHSQSITNSVAKGTSRWMAPELLLEEGARHSYASDVWACGCLFIEVWSAVIPYHTKTTEQQVIFALSEREAPARPPDLPDFLWSIVLDCCRFVAAARLPPSQTLERLRSDAASDLHALPSSVTV